jgi:succinate-semialdehyde dehydrogenase/glutarate-semialdehyde dehydrogenase
MTETLVQHETIAVTDPATGDEIGAIPAGSAAETDDAVRRARAAAPAWAATPAAERAGMIRAGARRVRDRLDDLAQLQSREGGKHLGDSRGGVEAGIGALEQYAELGTLHRGRSLQGDRGAFDLMRFEPRGVAAVLTPWNDPVAIAAQGIAANLAAGNVVILKPSERTPLSSALLVQLLAAELPPDVLLLLQGDARAGRPLVAHPGVDLVLHTGSIPTGREIARACAGTARKALLELGGKDPLIVDAGVDPAWAAAQAAAGAFANAGQICTSVERIYVHEAVAEPFLAALEREAAAWEPQPLIDDAQRAVVEAHVDEAVASGARLRCGGQRLDRPGSFYAATVLEGCDDDLRVMREETFGPVAAVRVVASFDEALRRAGTGEYGLAASVLTPSTANAMRATAELAVGTVKVNAVWGGAPGGAAQPRGASGTGFGYGPELLDEVSATKVVHFEPAPPAPEAPAA